MSDDFEYRRPGVWRRVKNWLVGAKEPEFSFQPDRETILLARDLLLARRARLGFLGSFVTPARNRYELVRAVRDVCQRTGIHEDEAIGWLGITRARYIQWSQEFGGLEQRFANEARVKADWADLIRRPWFWAVTLAGACAASVACFFFLDAAAVRYFDGFDQQSPGVRFWLVLSLTGNSATYYLFALFGLMLTWSRDRSAARSLVFFLLAITVAGLLVNLFKVVLGRPRPELFLSDGAWGFFQFAFAGGLDGAYKQLAFPSGHATHMAAVGMSLALLFPRYRYFFLGYAVLVGISRVVLIQHFPGDVVAGWTLGALTALVVYDRMFAGEDADSRDMGSAGSS